MKEYTAMFAGTGDGRFPEDKFVTEEAASLAAFRRKAKATAKQNGWRLVDVWDTEKVRRMEEEGV